ncbi:MAG TPA: DNA repair protein RecN [Terriglobales bacterium]|nr:DNA repair protein RecN [Terriglobales bacterium]
MLLELRVENYAVIDQVALEFGPGLNLLTGETGAGKSILIDALSLLLGEKSSSEMVRHGAEKAVVTAVFEGEEAAAKVLEANGLDAADGQLILRREIAAGGKGRVFVNNQPATVAVLKLLAPRLASIHAQNESVLAFDAAARLELLDAFAGLSTEPVARAFARWKSIRERMAELDRNEQERLRMVDLWRFQKKEIADAQLEPGEDVRLENEKRVLANAEKIRTAALEAYELLYEGQGAAAASLRTAARRVQELAGYDNATFREDVEALESARITAEEVGGKLRSYAGGINASPGRLAEIEDRLALLDRLKRKYGPTIEDVVACWQDVSRKLDEVENKDEVLRQLGKELAAVVDEYLTAAHAISKKRQQAAKTLEKLVEKEVNDLAMQASFRIEVESAEEEKRWTASGLDHVTYLISANPGEPLGPVEKIASGGELSRVMLALKATVESSAGVSPAVRRASRPPSVSRTLIFDEIDSGIGGRAAEAVGRKLKALAAGNQVICVTHLPQIASFADHHYAIEKREVGGRSRTRIRRLEPAERTEEIARMLSGAKLSETSRKHAEQLLKTNV